MSEPKTATIEHVHPRDISIPSHHRQLDKATVTSLAESIKESDLLQPIGLQNGKGDKYRLIYGRHRLAAWESLGRGNIRAIIHEVSDGEAELMEIDENIRRHPLSALEHTQAMARRKVLYEQIHPETKKGGDRKSPEKTEGKSKRNTCALIPTFAENAAANLDTSIRTAQRDTAIGAAISTEVAKKLAGTPIADNKTELEKMGKLSPARQLALAAKIKAGLATKVEEKPAPKNGKQTFDPKPFKELYATIGGFQRKIDTLAKQYPAEKFHRNAIRHLQDAMQTVDDWRKAVQI